MRSRESIEACEAIASDLDDGDLDGLLREKLLKREWFVAPAHLQGGPWPQCDCGAPLSICSADYGKQRWLWCAWCKYRHEATETQIRQALGLPEESP